MARTKLDIPDELLPLPEWRMAARFRLGPGWFSTIAFLFFVGGYLLYATVMGHPLLHETSTNIVPIETSPWATTMGSLMTVLGFWMMMTTPARTLSHLARLPYKAGVDARAKLLLVSQHAFEANSQGRWTMALGGMLTALVFAIFGISQMVPEAGAGQKWEHVAWFAIVLPFQFAIIGRGVFFMILSSRAMRQWAEQNIVVDPLNPDALRPFAQIALRSAFEWTVLLTVAVIISLGQNVDAAWMGPLYAAGFVLAINSFTAPLKVAREKLSTAKQANLRELDAAMVVERRIIEQGDPEGADAGQRLAGLAAYRAIVADAREWPLDLAVLSRLGLYLAIPVIGWVGSALVEELLSSAMKSP